MKSSKKYNALTTLIYNNLKFKNESRLKIFFVTVPLSKTVKFNIAKFARVSKIVNFQMPKLSKLQD